MRATSVATHTVSAVVLLVFAAVSVPAQSIDELRVEIEKIGSFEYEDLMSDNEQLLSFTEDCTLKMRMQVNWHDGGGWTTDYHIPLKDIRLDGMLIRQNSLEEPPGLFLETSEEYISVREDREGTVQNSKQYQVFIRTKNNDDAVYLTAYLRRIISSCLN